MQRGACSDPSFTPVYTYPSRCHVRRGQCHRAASFFLSLFGLRHDVDALIPQTSTGKAHAGVPRLGCTVVFGISGSI